LQALGIGPFCRILKRKTSPLDTPAKDAADVTWVEPTLVCNIRFTEITEDGSVRHPVFEGLRVDKIAAEVVLEKPKKGKNRQRPEKLDTPKSISFSTNFILFSHSICRMTICLV